LLSGGKWYRLDRDFVTEVNRYFDQLPPFDVALPEYNDNSEETYNTRVCDGSAEFALMDQQLIKYESGKRTGAWVKYRVNRGQEFVIGGYTPGNPLDAIIVGYYDDGKLLYAAKVKNGSSAALISQRAKEVL
jgi:bifunctional non-homologous end joining protein LigD